jgi:hypothetical protein
MSGRSADVAVLDGGFAQKKRALMAGLQQLVDADGDGSGQ